MANRTQSRWPTCVPSRYLANERWTPGIDFTSHKFSSSYTSGNLAG